MVGIETAELKFANIILARNVASFPGQAQLSIACSTENRAGPENKATHIRSMWTRNACSSAFGPALHPSMQAAHIAGSTPTPC